MMDEIEKGRKITQDLHALMKLARALGYHDIIVSVGLSPDEGEECGAISFCRNKFMTTFNREYIQKHLAISTENKKLARRNLEATVFGYGDAFKS